MKGSLDGGCGVLETSMFTTVRELNTCTSMHENFCTLFNAFSGRKRRSSFYMFYEETFRSLRARRVDIHFHVGKRSRGRLEKREMGTCRCETPCALACTYLTDGRCADDGKSFSEYLTVVRHVFSLSDAAAFFFSLKADM